MNYFPGQSSMWVVEWVKNNFCRGNKLRISGFPTILQLALSTTLKGNTIGLNTAKQCKYNNLHKQINTSRLPLWSWMQTAPFNKKRSLLPHWPLPMFNKDGPSYKDIQYISIHLIFKHIERNDIFRNFPIWEFGRHSHHWRFSLLGPELLPHGQLQRNPRCPSWLPIHPTLTFAQGFLYQSHTSGSLKQLNHGTVIQKQLELESFGDTPDICTLTV